MNKCKICGREFKSPQALGGHMRNAHAEEAQTVTASDNGSGNSEDIGETAGESSEPVEKMALIPQGASQAEQIRAYLKLGYTVPAILVLGGIRGCSDWLLYICQLVCQHFSVREGLTQH